MSTTVEGEAPAVERPPAEILAPVPATEKVKSKEGAEAKKPRASREKKPKQQKSSSHILSFHVIKEAIVTLNKKSGSSPYAINKYMEALEDVLPTNCRNILALHVKNSPTKERLIKVKTSYMISEAAPAKKESARPLSKTSKKAEAAPTKKRGFCSKAKQSKSLEPVVKRAKKVATA